MTQSLFDTLWQRCLRDSNPRHDGPAGELANALARKLEVEQVAYDSFDEAVLFLFDLTALGFQRLELNVFMFAFPPTGREAQERQISLLSDYKEIVRSLGFCFYLSLSEEVHDPFIPEYLEVINLGKDDLQRILEAERAQATLFEVIRRQVRISHLCPFNTTHEARGAMFKGRQIQREALVTNLNTNFIVTGARRMGKTSLLHNAWRDLQLRTSRPSAYYISCLNTPNYGSAMERIAARVAPKRSARAHLSRLNFLRMLREESGDGKRTLVLFLDEMDSLVDNDKHSDWRLFRLLYEAAQSRWIRIACAGFRSMHRLLEHDSPFYDALERVELSTLAKSDSDALLLEPFRRMDMDIDDPQVLADRVWDATKGMPFMIQFLGQQLYKRAIESPNPLQVSDLAAVLEDGTFHEFMRSHFLYNTVANGFPVKTERVALLAFAHAAKSSWGQLEFATRLDELGLPVSLDHLHQVLQSLVGAALLKRSGAEYEFALPALRESLLLQFPDLIVFVRYAAREDL